MLVEEAQTALNPPSAARLAPALWLIAAMVGLDDRAECCADGERQPVAEACSRHDKAFDLAVRQTTHSLQASSSSCLEKLAFSAAGCAG
mmetsp:Transcript_40213/g.95474  ORF Transcript_40213/g.95474 Transcript_40213/m.95474 type:complete len:89 (-) Transcript_40213:332-598(-)